MDAVWSWLSDVLFLLGFMSKILVVVVVVVLAIRGLAYIVNAFDEWRWRRKDGL